jgi:glycosyltransferase involved in cell wall biosynthesis
VTHRRLPQRIISIVHGDYDYYYEIAAASESRIDQFVCVSAAIADKLSILLPHRKSDIVFIPPVVPDMHVDHEANIENNLRIIFVGRLTPEKGFDLLPIVDHELQKAGISCNWTIVAPHATSDYDEWLNKPDVDYYEYVSNEKMPAAYIKQDVILLPSHAEGFPLSILEAMKCGVVPLATNLGTLANGIINHEETGFLFELNDVAAIVRQLKQLNTNRSLLGKMSRNAKLHARSSYSEDSFREKWTTLLSRKDSGKNLSKPVHFNYDRLDVPWLPNTATRAIRKWKSTEKGK